MTQCLQVCLFTDTTYGRGAAASRRRRFGVRRRRDTVSSPRDRAAPISA